MTNYYENLDAILTIYRLNYLNAYNKGEYLTACQLLFDRNNAHPPEAFVRKMPRFVVRADTLRAKIDLNRKAKAYCDYWNPRLELSMAEFRNKNQEQYNRI